MEDEARRDNIYASVHPELADFVFDEAVASVFADMIRRSVPPWGSCLICQGPQPSRPKKTTPRSH